MFGFIKDVIKASKDTQLVFECPRCGEEHRVRVFPSDIEKGKYSFVAQGNHEDVVIDKKDCDFCKAKLVFQCWKNGTNPYAYDVEQHGKEAELESLMEAASKAVEIAEMDVEDVESEIENLKIEVENLLDEYKKTNDKSLKEKVADLKKQIPEIKKKLPPLKKELKAAESAYAKLEREEEKLADAYERVSDKWYDKRCLAEERSRKK